MKGTPTIVFLSIAAVLLVACQTGVAGVAKKAETPLSPGEIYAEVMGPKATEAPATYLPTIPLPDEAIGSFAGLNSSQETAIRVVRDSHGIAMLFGFRGSRHHGADWNYGWKPLTNAVVGFANKRVKVIWEGDHWEIDPPGSKRHALARVDDGMLPASK